ncbi:citryl-CoA lyase [Sphingomonas sp. GB1N7]|uniref:citryl-CoA lyase n=1 Tax=Parasphingomonas caseinilytica TaxID=3096158 RepID=UPI002FC7872F
MTSGITTAIAAARAEGVTIRGLDLVDDIIGRLGFTEMTYFLCAGVLPTPAQTRVLDACLVTLMEHGWTPSSIIARVMADSVPEDSQVAIAAGLLSLGPIYAGTSEACAKLLQKGVDSPDPDLFCIETVRELRGRRASVPGFGHPLHKPDDPRTARLLAVAEEVGVSGRYVDLLQRLGRAVDATFGKHITINATGAIGALLLEIGLEPGVMRGLAVVSRASGLIGHVVEEHRTHAARALWSYAEHEMPYEADPA